VHTENYDLNSENFLFKTLEDLPENVRNGITEWHKLLRENLPEALTESVITFLCSSLALCLNTELLGYVYLTPDERGYIYSIPVCTDDDKKFMMKVFSKMNILIGKKTIDKWQSQSEKEFRHKVAKPFLRNRYFEYRENDLGSDESLKKAIEDIKEAFPQWQDIWNTLSEESIMRHYIRKKN
jgi:cation transport regulator ChaB